MTRIGTRAEVWFSNVVASFARYVAERTLPESVPMLMRRDAVIDSFDYAKENMKGAYSFLDRFEGLTLSIEEARRRFPSRNRVLEFGVYKAGMINHQARKFSALDSSDSIVSKASRNNGAAWRPPRPSISAANYRSSSQCPAGEGMVCRVGITLESRKSRIRYSAVGACGLRHLCRHGRCAAILRRLCRTWPHLSF